MTPEGRYIFKPVYQIKDKKSMRELLMQYLKGLDGIMLKDLQESLPNCDKHLKVNITHIDEFTFDKCSNAEIEEIYYLIQAAIRLKALISIMYFRNWKIRLCILFSSIRRQFPIMIRIYILM